MSTMGPHFPGMFRHFPSKSGRQVAGEKRPGEATGLGVGDAEGHHSQVVRKDLSKGLTF